MLKHLDDQGDLNILIDDAGAMLIVCSKCKKLWSGQLQLNEVTEDMNKTELRQVGNMIRLLRDTSPSLTYLKELGLNDFKILE